MIVPDFRKPDGKWMRAPHINGKRAQTISAVVWENIESRCRVGGAEQRRYPTYKGCVNKFLNYQHFVEWHTLQIGYGMGWQIDKDLLCKGNLEYSPEKCLLLPHELNSLIVKCNARRGDYPIGVFWDKTRKVFAASCAKNRGSVNNRIGSYATVEEAFIAYKSFKESFIKQQAEKWRDKIDPRAYNALMQYEVEITD